MLAGCLADIRACRICRDQPRFGAPLPHEPRPVLRLAGAPPVIVAGQAPGMRVHLSGTPFTDPSGDRLRDWLGVDAATFYDERKFGVVPMGFCFPGHDAAGGDRPPRRECAQVWHDRLFDLAPRPRLVVALGRPAQAWHLRRWGLAGHLAASVSDTVTAWRDILSASTTPRVFVLPHPSWRNNAWIAKRPWFAAELAPRLRAEVAAALDP